MEETTFSNVSIEMIQIYLDHIKDSLQSYCILNHLQICVLPIQFEMHLTIAFIEVQHIQLNCYLNWNLFYLFKNLSVMGNKTAFIFSINILL